MHKEYQYTSAFAAHIAAYIAERRSAGYMFDNPAYWLSRFDRFCVETKVTDPSMSKELFDAWSISIPNESKTTQNNRLEALKNFSVYLNGCGISSYVPHRLPMPEKKVPYLMSDDDIKAFFKAVDEYYPMGNVSEFKRLAYQYKVLFRMIYCCGLRNSEACELRAENIDLDTGKIEIIHSKGDKDRLVYLPEDLRLMCRSYRKWLRTELGYDSEWFFPGKDPVKFILKTRVDRKFNELWNSTENASLCDKKPTVHCLRHAFVIKRMNEWMMQGIDLNNMMPYLSNHLGHSSPLESFYYYHQVEDTFRIIKQHEEILSTVIPEVISE